MNAYHREVAQERIMSEQGVALVSVFLVLLMMTVLGIGALTMTGLENRVAGFASSMEASTTAAEACVQTGVKVTQLAHDASEGVPTVPTTLLDNQTPPGPVPVSNKNQLESEIEGTAGLFVPDVPIGPPYPAGVAAAVPNLVQTVGSYSVVGDIDFLYQRLRPGSSGDFNMFYRVDCVATNVATGIRSRIVAVYSCLIISDGCQRVGI